MAESASPEAAGAAATALPTFKGRAGWEFTDISRLDLAAYERTLPGPLTGAVAPLFGLPADPPALPDGVYVGPLDDAPAELLQGRLGSLLSADEDAFVALNEAGPRAGTLVWVPRGVVVEQPISLAAVQQRAGTLVNQRTLIVLESGAQAEVWEQLLSGEPELDGVFNLATELIVSDGARLRYVCGQGLSERSWIFGAQRAEVGRDGSLDWVALGFGSVRGHVRMETRLSGEGADARVTGAYATR
ncbi:MAG: SufD family Fe-S cluster assembly protein, partial [Solirubrobacteraceae bacterium]